MSGTPEIRAQVQVDARTSDADWNRTYRVGVLYKHSLHISAQNQVGFHAEQMDIRVAYLSNGKDAYARKTASTWSQPQRCPS